jgi:hypothetical protein
LRKSFSLFYTLVFLIIMSVVGLMIIRFSTYSSKHTVRSFMDTKADLISRSATEYAILALQGHDYKNGRLHSITINYPDFTARVRFHYFATNCVSGAECSNISTADTNMSVLIYVTVVSKNPIFNVRKVRVTLQNP